MAIKNSWASGEVLTAADLTDTFKGVFVNAQTGTSYTLGTADSFVSISNASGGTVTIPTNATAAFNTGAVVGIMNAGTAGTFTIAGAGGVTVNTTTGGTTLLPLETVYVVKLGTNTWQTKRDPGIANAGGLVYITGNTFSASSAVNVNNCFTSTYFSYLLMLNETTFSATTDLTMRLRVSGTDNSSANYEYYEMDTGTANRYSGQTSFRIANSGGYAQARSRGLTINGPNNASFNTNIDYGYIVNNSTTIYFRSGLGQMTVTTAYDGFSLIPSTGTITGTVRVYGYRNS